MLTHQPEDPERCESMELDNKIRDLIERNAFLDPKGVPQEATPSHRNSHPAKALPETALKTHSALGAAGMSAGDSSAEQAECAQSSRKKNSTNPLEQKIRCLEKQRKELLQVNQQWDQQFRSMKESYERKVAELRTKLRAAEGALGALERELRRSQGAGGGAWDPRREEERESLKEELQELKKENKLLKERNALAIKKKEHYECEIQRLNKALQDVLKLESSSSAGDRGGKRSVECSRAEMRMEMEVLKQQVQIYEEDFTKERADRERLNREKEELQRAQKAAQSQLARLSSQIKVCQMEKENLEKQLKQMCFPVCNCGLAFHLRDPWVSPSPGTLQDQREHPPHRPRYAPSPLPPDVQRRANDLSSERKAHQ